MAQVSRYDREPAGQGYGGDRDEYRGPDYGRGEYRGRDYGREDFGRGGWRGGGYRDEEREGYRGEGDYGREGRAWGGERGRASGMFGGDYGQGYGRRDYGREGGGFGDYGERGFGYRQEAYGYGGGGGREDFGRRHGEDYGRGGYRGGHYGRGGYGGREGERGWWNRASDEVASWFGDEDAERRRQMDERRGGGGSYGEHRGRGPSGYTRSDERIREDVSDRLTDDPSVDASNITVLVSTGEVTLSGTVTDRWAKRRAEDIAEDVSGVKHVQNNLRVPQQGGLTGGARQAANSAQQDQTTPTVANQSSPNLGRSSAA